MKLHPVGADLLHVVWKVRQTDALNIANSCFAVLREHWKRTEI